MFVRTAFEGNSNRHGFLYPCTELLSCITVLKSARQHSAIRCDLNRFGFLYPLAEMRFRSSIFRHGYDSASNRHGFLCLCTEVTRFLALDYVGPRLVVQCDTNRRGFTCPCTELNFRIPTSNHSCSNSIHALVASWVPWDILGCRCASRRLAAETAIQHILPSAWMADKLSRVGRNRVNETYGFTAGLLPLPCDLWHRRRDARYGYRSIIVGETSHPGPAAQSNLPSRRDRDNSRSPSSKEDNLMHQSEHPLPNVTPFPTLATTPDKRRKIGTRWKHFNTFSQAWSSMGVETDCIFVPAAMLPEDDENHSIFSNEDVEALSAAWLNGSVCWIHGSASPCVKATLRDRQFTSCYVSDVIRSDSGIAADPRQALTAPVGSLCSDLFCRSIKSVSVLERSGGWQDDKQQPASTYLYVFECQAGTGSNQPSYRYEVPPSRHA